MVLRSSAGAPDLAVGGAPDGPPSQERFIAIGAPTLPRVARRGERVARQNDLVHNSATLRVFRPMCSLN